MTQRRVQELVVPTILVICILLLVFAFRLLFQKPETSQSPTSPQGTNPEVSQKPDSLIPTITHNDRTFTYVYFLVRSADTLTLLPNFTSKDTATDIADTNACRYGISGGFYDTNSSPLGGFKSQSKVLKKPLSNRLIDGYLWAKGSTRSLTFSIPPEDTEFYLQTGPVLRKDRERIRISITNDQYRRRNVAGFIQTGEMIFMSIYNPDSVYEGPLLGDMPELIEKISSSETFRITDAVNLDGGSASAFVSDKKTLQEFSPIGSFFCVK